MSQPILLYDGVCGLCNRLTQFLLKRDRHDRLLFASLQSEFAAAILSRHGKDSHDLDTVYVVTDYEQPTEELLRLYHLVARNRYKVFGKHETCMLPEPKHRRKFLDVAAPTKMVNP
jgi:predicted DCC family thiol-disulfide oxidoreductase YuxK